MENVASLVPAVDNDRIWPVEKFAMKNALLKRFFDNSGINTFVQKLYS
jgi:hypothetical protein